MSIAMLFTASCVSVVFVAFYFIAGRPPKHQSHNLIYHDDDGEASSNSSAAGTKAYTSRLLPPILALGALSLSIMNWVLKDFDTRLGIIASGWIIVNAEVIILARESFMKQRFTIGLLVTISSLSLSVTMVVDDNTDYNHHIALWCQLGLGTCLAIVCSSLRRRPTVYFEGKAVDAQMTCSAIERCTFAWIRPLLNQARKVRSLEYDDLACLGRATRSRDLRAHFPLSDVRRRPLWRCIVSDHYPAIIQQWLTAVAESIVSMLPPICMYKILSLLEERSSEKSLDRSPIWMWIIFLAGSKIVHVCLSNWLQWVSFALFAIPVRSQLSAVIFSKALQMKSVQGSRSETRNTLIDNDTGDEDAHEMDTFLPQEEDDGQDPECNERSSENAVKGIVNLLGVDVQRVAEFCGYNMDLLRGAVKVTAAACLLATLIGWWSTLAGFAVPIVLHPLNRVATKYYTSRQLEVMEARDNKAHVVTEALHGMRQIKFSATELQWEKRILNARERELQAQWDVYVWAIFLTFAWIAMPALIGAAALSVYAWTSKEMIPSVAFTALSIFSSLEWTIGAVPTTITEMLDARVSAKRIQEHINSEERVEKLKEGEAVEFRDVSVAWPSNSHSFQDAQLRALNLRFPPNKLSVIHGKTGAGKSLLLAAIIGEADIISGELLVPHALPMEQRDSEHATASNWILPSAFAYVGQVPWIENLSVKDTILYGLPYRHERYMRVIHACALVEDIKMLPDGEETEVGATGINLSGGQRWRLTFARALYSRAGILVLDDIFSAVDSHVGRHLLDNGILGPLGANRTKILVTHHVDLVQRYATCIITLNDDGTASILQHARCETPINIEARPGVVPEPPITANDIGRSSDLSPPIGRKFVEDEIREQGRVKWKVYKTYILASGGIQHWLLTLVLFSLAALSVIARSYWLALWTRTYTMASPQHGQAATTAHSNSEVSQQPHLVFYLGIYVLISMISVSLVAVKITFVLVASLRAARHLFEIITQNVLRVQLRWLDTQPVGRILNRFVGDFALVDSKLGGDMTWCANGLFSMMTIIAAALFISIWMLIPVVVLSLLCIYVVYLYLDAARDIKRLESSTKSPMFELVGSTLSGLATIRSFARANDYLERMYRHIDRYSQSSWHILLATQWMRFRQGVLGVLFTLCIATGVAYFPSMDASLAGFALSFALDFSAVVENTVSRYTSTELDMNSAERVLEYMHLPTETTSGAEALPSWPSKGKIEVRDLEVAYANDLEPVLKGISFSVQPGQRIGIVGRTGSGKSSLTLALLRFLEARQGSIKIDGMDLSTLKLHDVRSRLAIIPQDPVLFSGTLRHNLDPLDEHSDSTLLEVLARVTPASDPSYTAPRLKDIFTNLSSSITTGGSNLSQGEKQLVCLARAMITQSKVMILDEATSAVDMATDALIQRSIREEFRNSTLLVVAHRLSTIADFDKILVLSNGRLAEYGEPKILAQTKGVFWKMITESGEKEALGHLTS